MNPNEPPAVAPGRRPPGIPIGPIHEPPWGAIPHGDERGAMTKALHAAALDALDGIALGAYDRRIAEWLAQWDVPTVATIASWVIRGKAIGATAGYAACLADQQVADECDIRPGDDTGTSGTYVLPQDGTALETTPAAALDPDDRQANAALTEGKTWTEAVTPGTTATGGEA